MEKNIISFAHLMCYFNIHTSTYYIAVEIAPVTDDKERNSWLQNAISNICQDVDTLVSIFRYKDIHFCP